MMNVLVTGAAGMLGRKLTGRLVADGHLGGEPIASLVLVDLVESDGCDIGQSIVADVSEPDVATDLVASAPDVVFHLAGVVSGEAERDFEKGMRVNLDGTRQLFEALRRSPAAPRVVFTSSIAVFGAPFPDGALADDFHLTPRSSYGVQKAMCELMVSDFTRRGFFDGVSLRLPTISVRPGRPNAAASGFFSGIIREPLSGLPGVLPVSREIRHSHASPRSAVGYLMRAATLDTNMIGPNRSLNMPGVSVSVGDQIDALGRVGGPDAVALIREEPDEAVAEIVGEWPIGFRADRARALGFNCERTYDEVITAYIEDDLNS